MRSCSSNQSCPEEKFIKKIDTVYINNSIEKKIYIPKLIETKVGFPIYKDIDTLAILKDFFAKNIYEDSIKIGDSLGYIFVRDTISQNKIISRITKGNYKIPYIKEEINKIIPPINRNQLYIGFDIIGNKKEPINYFGPGLTLKTKNDKIYDFGLGLTPNGDISGKFGMKWKIKLK